VHPILVSGGSEGAILHWDLTTPEPTFSQPSSQPRATLSQAHDSNVWSLAFHPLGHLLVSASNDHTTRFWSRERPGDASSVFSGGGEKPPEMIDMGGQDEEDDAMVPGFSYGGAGWYGKEEEAPGFVPLTSEGGYRKGALVDGEGVEDFIPGFSTSDSSVIGRQGGPLPSQEDMFVTGSGTEDWSRGGEDWGRGGGAVGGRGRWGVRRGRY